MSGPQGEKPPFSYAVKVGGVSHNPLEVHLEADDRERVALARLWSVESVDSFSADLKIRRWKKDGVKIIGEVRATVTQSCVVTLEPVKSDILEEIDQIFVPEGSALARLPQNEEGEILIDPEGPDLPDVFVGDTIDVGDVAAEFAAMGIDAYPRKPGVTFEAPQTEVAPEEKKPSPFAVLKNLKVEK